MVERTITYCLEPDSLNCTPLGRLSNSGLVFVSNFHFLPLVGIFSFSIIKSSEKFLLFSHRKKVDLVQIIFAQTLAAQSE